MVILPDWVQVLRRFDVKYIITRTKYRQHSRLKLIYRNRLSQISLMGTSCFGTGNWYKYSPTVVASRVIFVSFTSTSTDFIIEDISDCADDKYGQRTLDDEVLQRQERISKDVRHRFFVEAETDDVNERLMDVCDGIDDDDAKSD